MARPGMAAEAWRGSPRDGVVRNGMVFERYHKMSDVYEFGNTLNALVNNANNLNAQKAGEEIERQRQKHGGTLTPRQLWESQKSNRAKLHKHFEWDDAVAADKHRDQQAALLIRSVKVVFEGPSGEEQSVRAFSSVRDPNQPRKRVYVQTTEAMQDQRQRDEILQQALNGLVSWRRRWSELSGCAEVMSGINQAIDFLRNEVISAVDQATK